MQPEGLPSRYTLSLFRCGRVGSEDRELASQLSHSSALLRREAILDSTERLGKHAYVPALDGLRAMVLLVPLSHLEYAFPLFSGTPIDAIIRRLGFTLALFFVLSGFLITWILSSEYQATGSISLGGFYRRRAQRLLPAYATALIVSCVLLIANGTSVQTVARDSVWFLTYTYNIGVAWHSDLCAAALASFMLPAWSLCVEEQFYLSWALIVRWLKPQRAFVFVVLAVIASPIYRGAAYLWMLHHGWSRTEIMNWMYFATESNIGHIFTGCAMALALRDARVYERTRRLVQWRFFTMAAVLGVVFFFIAVPMLLGSVPGRIPLFAFTLGFSAVGVGVAALVLAVIMRPQTFTNRLLSHRLLVYIGRISYGIYIFHYILINMIDRFNVREYGGRLATGMIALEWTIVLAGSVAVAAIHYQLIELPILKRRKRQSGVAERRDVQRNLVAVPMTGAMVPDWIPLDDAAREGRRQTVR